MALKLARKYSFATDAPEVWLARLDVEKAADEHDVQSTWSMACATVHNRSQKADVEKIWLWGLDHLTTQGVDQSCLFEVNTSFVSFHPSYPLSQDLLKKSIQDSSTRSIHETLLLRYISDVVYSKRIDETERHKLIQNIPIAYLPTKAVWEHLFSLGCLDENVSKTILCTIYGHWRNVDGVRAALEWAGWLAEHGDGREAMKVIKAATVQLSPAERAQLNQLWNSRLNQGRRNDENGEHEGDGEDEEENTGKSFEEMPIVLTIE